MAVVKKTPSRKQIREAKNRYSILALDVAIHCGWAISKEIYGVWDLTPKRDESKGMKLIRFRSKLLEVIESNSISLIVFERTAGFHKAALIAQAELHGVLKLILEDLQIEYRAYSASEIKQFATGKGNSGKPAMVAAAQKLYNYPGKNDNEADALHILHLAKKDYA